MRLSAISELNGHERGRIAVAKMLEKSPLIRFLDEKSAFQEAATSDTWRPVNASSTHLINRDIDDGYTKKALAIESLQTTTHKIAGNAIKIDKSYLADAERNLLDIKRYLDERFDEEIYAWIIALETQLFQGTGVGDPSQFKGLQAILDGDTDLPGFPGETGVLNAVDALGTGDSCELSSTNYDKFVEFLRKSVDEVPGANGILMAPAFHARFCSIADERHQTAHRIDDFGYQVRQFDGIDLVKMLTGSISLTEPDDATTPVNETTSLWVVRAAENQVSLLTNSGLYYNEADLTAADKVANAMEWEFRGSWRIKKKDAIRRIRNIKLATS